jgi:hypothetical protein
MQVPENHAMTEGFALQTCKYTGNANQLQPKIYVPAVPVVID